MTELLSAIEWESPLFPAVQNPSWESEVKRTVGGVADLYRRISPNPWLRSGTLSLIAYTPAHVSQRLVDIPTLVAARENSCRYCYGVARSQMKILGYSESHISKLEREVQLAELTRNDRVFVAFCRSLSRSSPVRSDRIARS